MTKEQKQKILELMKQAAVCEANGIDPKIQDGTAWALCRAGLFPMVTDGVRFWERPQLIQEFDLFDGGVVTCRYYLRNIQTVPQALIMAHDNMEPVMGEQLPEHFQIYETVIFDHTLKDSKGRTWREVYPGDWRDYGDWGENSKEGAEE